MIHFKSCTRIRLLQLGLFVFCLIVAVSIVLFYRSYPFDDRAFSAPDWRADESQRMAMADSLVRDHLTKGMQEEQVLELLGPSSSGPQGTANRWDTALAVDHCHEYSVGHWSLGGMDDAFLIIFFDSQGKLIEARVDGY